MPDVILMDINLPGISGVEADEDPGRDPATAHIPVVALSANAMPRDIEKGLEAGFFRYLTKPIKVSEFMETLDVALKFATSNRGPCRRKGTGMKLTEPDILNASILVVDDQEANVRLLEQLLSEAGYTNVADHHESARSLRAAPQEPLRPDPARPADARHGRLPGDGRPQDQRSRRLPAGAS
jgi:CheY-like chemotaxis protein